MSDESIRRLRDLTKQLPDNVVFEYDMPKGRVFGMGLVKKCEVGVQDALLEKGTDFPAHLHDGAEWLIVYKGCCIVRWGETKDELKDWKLCKPGDYVFLPPDTWHTAEMLEDTWMIGVTVPADMEGYPEGVISFDDDYS